MVRFKLDPLRSLLLILPIGLLAVAMVGCNKGPKLYDVKGKVNVDGKATGGVNLLFFKDGVPPAVTSAVSADDGSFSLTTNTLPGIPEGKYKVAAVYPDPAFKPRAASMGEAPPDPPDLFKGRYGMQKSTVNIEVTPSSTEAVIDLTLQ